MQKKSSDENVTCAVVSVYSCDIIKHPLNVAEILKMREDATAGHRVTEEPVIFP